MKKDYLNYQDDDKNFLKEIEILKNINHPNIIKILESFEDVINFYLIIEYIEGGDLIDFLNKESKISEDCIKNIVFQLLSAVNYLHKQNIVHRDIKPENILVVKHKDLLTDNDNVEIKVIDFGTSNYIKEKFLTLKVGTSYYMAPEVYQLEYNEKCDIWSCGILLFVLLVGYPPFMGKSNSEVKTAVLFNQLEWKETDWEFKSTESQDLVSLLLKKDYNTRISAETALKHKWFAKTNSPNSDFSNKVVYKNALENIKKFNKKNIFYNTILGLILYFEYYSKEIDDLKLIFKEMDKNSDGLLSFNEIQAGFKRVFGENLGSFEFESVLSYIKGTDYHISWSEFLQFTISRKELVSESYLKQAFERYDINQDGKLSKNELRNIVGDNNDEYLNTILDEADLNKNGFIEYDEFIKDI